MSYNSKKMIISIAAGVLLMIAYVIYAFGGTAPASEDLKAWAAAMLIFIGIGVAAIIAIQIIFHIALAIGISIKEKEYDGKKVQRIVNSSMLEDERDKLIDLKADRIGHAFTGFGFIAALVALVCGLSAVTALHILFASLVVGSLIEGSVSIYYYERGVHNG